MTEWLKAYLRHHVRFYSAALAGVVLFALLPGTVETRALAAGDLGFLVYLSAMSVITVTMTPQDLVARAAWEDEGIALVLLVVLGAIGFCVSAVFSLLAVKKGLGLPALGLAMLTVPLGWATLHTVAAFHYANLYYAPQETKRPPLQFPDTDCPGPWEFVYYAFVIGMTFQVADVNIASPVLRRATLGHSVVSFFFNTAIVAMAVNAAVNLTS